MNKRNKNTSPAPLPGLLLVPALALCLATIGCSREAEVPGDSADATNPTAGVPAAPQVDADQALADRTAVDPCAGLSGATLDDCRMRQDSAEVMGEVPTRGEPPLDEPYEDQHDPLDAAMPPPVTEEPMDNEPVEEGAEEVPPPA